MNTDLAFIWQTISKPLMPERKQTHKIHATIVLVLIRRHRLNARLPLFYAERTASDNESVASASQATPARGMKPGDIRNGVTDSVCRRT